MAEKRKEDASRDRSVNEASGSDHELSSDFVEGPEWKRNDGRNCALSLFIKYSMAQRKKIFKEAKSIPCTQNFLAYWNFYTKNKQGQKVFNDIVKKYCCSVTVSADDEDLYIFDVTCMIFKWESDVFNFVNDVLNSIYECAKQSLCCDVFSVDHRIQEDTLQRVKERKELHPAWIEVVGEHDPDAVHVVCAMKDKVSVLIELTEIVSKAKKCYNNCEETVAVDFMWQRVLKIFGYLQKFNDKFSNIMIEPDESKDAVMLKGPRDETKAAADHFMKLLRTAHSEVHEKLFSPVFMFEILMNPEMCDYIGNFIPKVSILWIPNNLTKKIHIFSKQPEQAKGTEKVIKGCIQEKLYTSSKYHSLFRTGVESLENLKQKYKGKIMIQTVDPGLLVTTADDIFETVDAEIQAAINKEIGSAGHITKTVHPTGVPSGYPTASQRINNCSKMCTIQLNENMCVKVYVCSIVEVKNVDAIACEVDTDFSIKGHAVAQMIKKAGGSSYEEEFKQLKLRLKPREDVLICGAGKLAKTQNIKYVIHVKLGKIESLDDIEMKMRHLVIQIFGNACQKKMLKIALPLIGAATLKRASDDVIQHCSRLYVKILQEVVASKGNDMSVEEVHLVDLDENIISFVVKAFEEQTTSNHEMPDQKERSFKKSISSKTPAKMEFSGGYKIDSTSRCKDEMVSHSSRPGNGEAWLTTVMKSEPQRSVRNQHSSPTDEKCAYKCGQQGTKKKYPDCSHALCDRCFVPCFESECPICKPITDKGNKMIKKITEEKASKGGNNTESEESDTCPICMDAITNPKHLTCGHDFHYDCIKQSQKKQPGCPICGKEMKETIKETASKEGNIRQSEETENCPICMDILTKPKCLPCGHNFHADCIMQSLEYKPACPICGTVMGQIIGNQPEGTITVNVQNYSLPGYNDCNTIEIFYNIPDGHQQENHPHPGKPYKGTHRKAFLPDNSEGRKVLELLKIAFKRKLIFTIGESRTTGKTDIVTWNDIHHKTRVDGGPTNFGYPDKTYLSRVQEELAAKGVTEKDIKPDDISCTIS